MPAALKIGALAALTCTNAPWRPGPWLRTIWTQCATGFLNCVILGDLSKPATCKAGKGKC
jgi:hypothetical protein